MSVNFEIITKDFEDALAKYKVACRKDWQFVIRQQSRIVGEKLVKFTPPKTAAIGKRNVAREIVVLAKAAGIVAQIVAAANPFEISAHWQDGRAFFCAHNFAKMRIPSALGYIATFRTHSAPTY